MKNSLPFTLFFVSFCLLGEDACFTNPKELSIFIYPGNNGFAIFHVLKKNSKKALSFDYVGISISGKPSKKRWSTRLLIDIDANSGNNKLNFIMTMPDSAAKEGNHFYLQADRPFLKGPSKLLPLEIKHEYRGFFIFQSHTAGRMLKINIENNTATLSWIPEKRFDVRWHKDGFDLFYNSTYVDTWLWKTVFKIGFRGINSGITSVYAKNSPFTSFFSKKELFYLTSTE